ncbi:hypothetical protein G7Y89_g2196 [Cudoniella acicularis]|uniref:Ribosomal RNA-processing protein 43 n=1 Tax=Cudoniella acicularis TaxID=354080 RepID=A0A8H4RVJ7_9HELO|nr:hypothetical protein G7Y89_g2196 [Cudoniella acicularis]
MVAKKRIQLCFLETACTGSYMASGQWRSTTDNGKTKDRLKYYTDLAKLAEKGKISCVFLANWYVGFDVYNDSLDTMLKAGHQVGHLDPVPIISAMAAVTKTVAFAAIVSTSYVNPYILARLFSTLNHITNGRVGWNIVTSYTKGTAKAMGHDEVIPRDERYLVADVYMKVAYKLWESSWGPESIVWSDKVAFDPTQIKKIEHKGKYFKMSGRSQIHSSPQRTPVLFQAGTSKSGTAFAGRHAEAMFLNPCTVNQAKKVIAEARTAAASKGRDPQSLKFSPCIVPIIGRTEGEAKAKYETAKSYADVIGGLAQFPGYTVIDMNVSPMDEPSSPSTLKGGYRKQVISTITMTTTATPQSTLSFPRETFAKLSPHPYLLAHLRPTTNSPSKRANGRQTAQFRTPHINNGSLTHAEGSAVVRIGDTTVVCGIRGEILLASNVPNYRVEQGGEGREGYNEAKELDLLVPNIELATGCSPQFLPGQPPSTLAQSLSTRVYSLLHSSGLVDSKDLKIWYAPPQFSAKDQDDDKMDESGEEEEEELEVLEPEVKAFWTLYIDILFISLDGNPFDAAWAAVMSALKDVRLPKAYWDPDREMILCEDSVELSKKLSLKGCPVAVTSLVFRAKEQKQSREKRYWILVDPDTFEEGLCDESVTVVVDCGGGETKLLGIEKAGGTVVGKKELRSIVEIAEKRWTEMSTLLNG